MLIEMQIFNLPLLGQFLTLTVLCGSSKVVQIQGLSLVLLIVLAVFLRKVSEFRNFSGPS